MASNATETVARYLESDAVRPQLETLVRQWNVAELLGINLADLLRKMMEERVTKTNIEAPLDEVDWNGLAERYALEICDVDEDELLRRSERYRQD